MDRHKGGLYVCTASNGVGVAAMTQVNVHVLCKYSRFVFIRIVVKYLKRIHHLGEAVSKEITVLCRNHHKLLLIY